MIEPPDSDAQPALNLQHDPRISRKTRAKRAATDLPHCYLLHIIQVNTFGSFDDFGKIVMTVFLNMLYGRIIPKYTPKNLFECGFFRRSPKNLFERKRG